MLLLQFNSPVEVNWEYMDSELMQRFWASHADERASKASISDRILVFHRGISTVKKSNQPLSCAVCLRTLLSIEGMRGHDFDVVNTRRRQGAAGLGWRWQRMLSSCAECGHLSYKAPSLCEVCQKRAARFMC